MCPLVQILLGGGFLLHLLPQPTENESDFHHQVNMPGSAEISTVLLASCIKV